MLGYKRWRYRPHTQSFTPCGRRLFILSPPPPRSFFFLSIFPEAYANRYQTVWKIMISLSLFFLNRIYRYTAARNQWLSSKGQFHRTAFREIGATCNWPTCDATRFCFSVCVYKFISRSLKGRCKFQSSSKGEKEKDCPTKKKDNKKKNVPATWKIVCVRVYQYF